MRAPATCARHLPKGWVPLDGSAGNYLSGEALAHRACALLFFFVRFLSEIASVLSKPSLGIRIAFYYNK